MDESIEKEMNLLFSNFWITKENAKEDYYLLKRNQEKIKNFLSRTLGNKLIVHDRFIKLEKIPSMPNKCLAISTFVEQMDYVMLFLFLLFLEDKTRGEKFILSSLIEYIRNTAITLELEHVPDWKNANNRRSLLRVIDYLLLKNVITLRDTDNKNFQDTEEADALYEATGLANYLLPSFDYGIFNNETPEDFLKQEWANQDEDKGDVRKYKVYRNLIYLPMTMRSEISFSEEDYLKKMHKVIEKELQEKINMEVEITRNMYMVFVDETQVQKNYFPNTKNISDLVLIMNRKLLEYRKEKQIAVDEYECFQLTYEEFEAILKNMREEEKRYFSKGILDMGISKFQEEMMNFMSDYHFIKLEKEGILIFPLVSRFIGKTEKIMESTNEQLELGGVLFEL